MAQYRKYSDMGGNQKDEKAETVLRELTHIENRNQKQREVLQNKVTCVYVWGNFCRSCKTAAPDFVAFSKDYRLRHPAVKFCEEDVNLGLSSQCKAVPTILVYVSNMSETPIAEIQGANFQKLQIVLDDVVHKLKL